MGSLFCFGQNENRNIYPSNSIFVELAGNSIFYGSINYERVFVHNPNIYLTGRFGVGYGSFAGLSILSGPTLINGIFKIHKSIAFETGIGVAFMQVGREGEAYSGMNWTYEFQIAPTAQAGLRVQSQNGFLFRLCFTPFIAALQASNSTYKFYPSVGMSFGYSFGK